MDIQEAKANQSELDAPIWSVLDSNGCAASSLTYAEAKQAIEKMKGQSFGLCIVTDAAACKIHGANRNYEQSKNADIPAPSNFAETL